MIFYKRHLISINIRKKYPDAPCMEYLPTFTPKMTQMYFQMGYDMLL